MVSVIGSNDCQDVFNKATGQHVHQLVLRANEPVVQVLSLANNSFVVVQHTTLSVVTLDSNALQLVGEVATNNVPRRAVCLESLLLVQDEAGLVHRYQIENNTITLRGAVGKLLKPVLPQS